MTTPSSTQVTPDRMLMPHEAGPKVAKEGLHSLLSHYCSVTEKRLDYGQLLSMARYELSKYGLPPAKVREIAPVYARTLKMHLEQNGYETLDPTFKEEMERQVLHWCGMGRSASDRTTSQRESPGDRDEHGARL
jgi:hypothetical protein